jgi:hypothetical protein
VALPTVVQLALEAGYCADIDLIVKCRHRAREAW